MYILSSPSGNMMPLAITDGNHPSAPPKPKIIIGVLLLLILLSGKKEPRNGGCSGGEVFEQATETDLMKDNGVKIDMNPATFEDRIKQETYVEADLLTTRWSFHPGPGWQRM